jgi:hypothetical protein
LSARFSSYNVHPAISKMLCWDIDLHSAHMIPMRPIKQREAEDGKRIGAFPVA